MLKTSRAYFCHTVTEASPWGRIISHARQSIEGLFKRPAPRTDGIIVKVPQQPQARAWSGGLVSQIHSNSRGILTKFAERTRTSELINATTKRYGWRNAFRGGIWGSKLSMFAFVGVGVSAGAQWNAFDGNIGVQDRLIVELFARKSKFEAPVEQEPETILVERALPEPVECDISLSLTENDEHDGSSEPSYILLSDLTFDDNGTGTTGDQFKLVTSETDFIVHSEIISVPDFEMISFEISDDEEKVLLEELEKNLVRVEEQREELSRVRAKVEQLNELLRELLESSGEEGSSVICIDQPPPLEVNIGLGDGSDTRSRLIRSLSVIGQQQSQLSLLRDQLLLQNQQLRNIHQAASERPMLLRSSFSKRDACCGPGRTLSV